MNEHIRIFLNSLGLYIITAVLALAAAWRHVTHLESVSVVGPLDVTWQNGLIFLVVFVVFTYVMVRFVRVARVSLSFFLAIALIAGTQFILSGWMPFPWDIVGSICVGALVWYVPRVVVHDIAIVFGIGGIAALLGLAITPLVACVLLAVLSVYDIISVYRTHHMVTLAGHMMESGAVFGFLVPARVSGFLQSRDDALRARSVMMLGSGDIGLPLVLAASAVSQSIPAACLVATCSLVGVSTMHWLFMHQKHSQPMAALPPIAVSAILGYAIAIALGI